MILAFHMCLFVQLRCILHLLPLMAAPFVMLLLFTNIVNNLFVYPSQRVPHSPPQQ